MSQAIKIWQDALGEAAAGVSQSQSYILNSGFISTIQPNPPTQTQVIPNQSWPINTAKPSVFDLDDYFLSPDGYNLTYSTSGNTRIQVAIDAVKHTVSFSQPTGWSGAEKVVFTARSPDGDAITGNQVSLSVIGNKNPPVLDFIPDIITFENSLVTITPHATDADGGAITYSFTPPLDTQGRWQTNYNSAGTYTVKVTACDSTGLCDYRDVRIVVRNVNRPPSLNALSDITAQEGGIVRVIPQAVDPDGDAITYYYSAPLDATGKWLTGYNDAGTYTVTVTASDGIATVSRACTITVSNTNRAPQAALTLNKYTANPNESVIITLTASDPDNDSMTFSLKKDGAVIASGNIAGVYTATTSFTAVGDHRVEAMVTDSGNLSASASKGVDVVDPADSPATINPLVGDFNGDAITDLGIFNSSTGKWEICLSKGGAFENAVDWLIGVGTTADWWPVGGDFNGDGKTDVGSYNNTNGQLLIALSTGAGFTYVGTWIPAGQANSSWQPFTGNFNGDKFTDFALYNKTTGQVLVALSNGAGFSAATAWAANLGTNGTASGGDFNGDGLTDICIFTKSSGAFKVAFSDTRAFVDGATWISGFGTNRDALISDFNNDGLADAGYWDSASGAWYYAISTGAQFVAKGLWLSGFGTSLDESATTGDFNGDGVTDAAVFDRDKAGIDRWKVQLTNAKPADLLIASDNGIGGQTHVTYAYAAKYGNDQVPFPVYVVSSVSLVDTMPVGSTAEAYTQNFIYSGGYYDALEREFRGFADVTATDPITGNYTQTIFYQGRDGQDGTLKGQIEKVIAYDGNGRFISQTVNTYEIRKAGPAEHVVGFPALKEQVTVIAEENGSSLTTANDFIYDNIGNVLEVAAQGDITKTGDEKNSQTTYAQAYAVGFNRPLTVQLKGPDGATVSQKDFEYDPFGNLTKEKVFISDPLTTDSGLSTVDYSYDSFGNLVTTTNALGSTVTTEYESDFYAYPVKVTNSLGHTVTNVYDLKLGVVVSTTDPNGNVSCTAYDSFGRVTEVKNAYDQVVATYAYPDFNTKVSTQGNLSKIAYIDGLGRAYKTVSSGEDGALARSVSAEVFYNTRGQVEKEALPHYVDEDPAQVSYTRYEYDIRGRVKKTIADFPGTAKDAESQVNYISPLYVETLDPLGHRKGTLKDVYGNILEVTEFTPGGVQTTSYVYDIQGSLTKLTDALGNVTQLFYDSIGRKVKMIDPDMGTWTYEYDALGNLVKQTDAKAQVLAFEYDVLNRLVRKGTFPVSAGTVPVVYTYDDPSKENCLGRLSKVIDSSGSTEFFYDKLGREIKSIKSVGGASYTVERTYDIFDRLTSLKYPDGEIISYTYDAHSGLLEAVKGTVPVQYVKDISYSATGQIKTIAYGNNTQTTYTYGQDLRLARILTQGIGGLSSLQDLNYTFDRNGNIVTLADNLHSNIRSYTYDCLDRLIRAQNSPSPQGGYTTFDYQYDAIGNMTYKSDVGVMGYGGGHPHAVTSAGGYTYSYDANGNMVSGKNKTLAYDAENRLIQASEGGIITSFQYDGDGGRVRKGTGNTSTTYIGSLFEIQRLTAASQRTVKHIFAGSQRVCSVTKDEGSGKKDFSYYHSDHLGSSNVVTDANGNLSERFEYTPYGSVATQELVSRPSSLVNHRFTGKELDSTGLYFYGARYYDPELGRFITADTIVQAPYDPQSLNRYSYCRNNPLNYVDPSGHVWWFVALLFIAKAAAVVSAVTAIAGGISYATGNYSLASTFFQISQYSGYAAAAAGIAAFATAAIVASQSQSISVSQLIHFFDDSATPVDLGRIVIRPTLGEAVATAWSVTKDAVAGGIGGVLSAVASGLAIDAAAAIAIIKYTPPVMLENFLIDGAVNGFHTCPRYANYGGSDWSGGRQIRAGEIGPDIPPRDQMDGLYKEHDFSAYDALKVSMPSGKRSLRMDADRRLYKRLRSLPKDPSRWSPPAPDSDEARGYRAIAEWWFGDILGYKND